MIHVEFLVEELSAESALRTLVPKIIGSESSFAVRRFQGKPDLLKKLPGLLCGYAQMRWEDLRVVVLVDRDTDDSRKLKQALIEAGEAAGVRSDAVLHRIAIDELESWFLGDAPALCTVYERLPRELSRQARYRDPDRTGKASRALEDLFRSNGYHRAGLAKVECAEAIAPHMDVENNRSRSFQVFRDGLRRLVKEGNNA